MLAWQKFGNGETPESSGMKGDHLVGKYYVLFEKNYRIQVEKLVKEGMDEAEAKNSAPLMKETREMLLKWEAGDKEVVDLWKMMNSWVYAGFDETYKKLGVDFDKIYYESDTYKIGKDIVLTALKDNILYRMKIVQYGLILLRKDWIRSFSSFGWYCSIYDTGSWNSCRQV